MQSIYVAVVIFMLLAAFDQKCYPIKNKALAVYRLFVVMCFGGLVGLVSSLLIADGVPTKIRQDVVMLHPLDTPEAGADKTLLLTGRQGEIFNFTVRYAEYGKLVWDILDNSVERVQVIKNLGPDMMITYVEVLDKSSALYGWSTFLSKKQKVLRHQILVHIDHIEDAVRLD